MTLHDIQQKLLQEFYKKHPFGFPDNIKKDLDTLLQDAYNAGREDCVDEIIEKMKDELELSCVDDRLLGKTDEYLEGYNTSTERWRQKRDNIIQSLTPHNTN